MGRQHRYRSERVPLLGRVDNVYYSMGYLHGVAPTHIAAEVIANAMEEQSLEAYEKIKHWRIPLVNGSAIRLLHWECFTSEP